MTSALAIKVMRTKLGLTQAAFASLLGVGFVNVNRWENKRAEPSGFGAIALFMLENIIDSNDSKDVVTKLRRAGGERHEVIRILGKFTKERFKAHE